MFRYLLSLFFLVQIIFAYFFEIDQVLKLNRILVPIGLYYLLRILISREESDLIRFIGIFIMYVAVQSIFTADVNFAVALLLSDEGGLFCYLSVGLLSALALSKRKKIFVNIWLLNKKYFSITCIFILLGINILLGLNAIQTEAFGAITVGDVRLESDSSSSDYQVVGEAYFLAIALIMIFISILQSDYFTNRKWQYRFEIFLVTLFLLTGVINAQIFGSNSATVLILGIMMIYICNILISRNYLTSTNSIKFQSQYGRFVITGILLSLFLIATAVSLLYYFELTNAFRIFNFGEEDSLLSSSIINRLLLLEFFFENWNISPIFGHMKADVMILEDGKFAHSLPLSLLSHTGLVGFSLFMIPFLIIMKRYFFPEFEYTTKDIYVGINERAIIFLVLSFTFLASFWATGLAWFSIGYALGMNIKKN